MSTSEEKLSLQQFLTALTKHDAITMQGAMTIASKIYKTHSTPAQLGMLTDDLLQARGVTDSELRKGCLTAVKKAGFKQAPQRDPVQTVNNRTKSSPKKRKRVAPKDDEIATAGPSRPTSQLPNNSNLFYDADNLDFKEILDETVIGSRSTVVNRAPVMMAWATVVCEHMGFQREEALSIASVYTEANAITKGVSLNIFSSAKGKGLEPAQGEAQPYVDLMGRRPLFESQNSQWRGLLKGSPTSPSDAFNYITRALRQTTPHIVGAMRLLARSYTPEELNDKGFGLYAEFRPAVGGWGERGEVKCSDVLSLRKSTPKPSTRVELEPVAAPVQTGKLEDDLEEPSPKKARGMTVEEYEAALDEDGFDHLDLSELP